MATKATKKKADKSQQAEAETFAPALITLRKGGQDWQCDPVAEKARIKHLKSDGFVVVDGGTK